MSDPYWLSDEGPLTPETRERLLAHVRESGFDAESVLDDALNQYLDRAKRGRAEAAEFLQEASLAWEQAILSGGRELTEVKDRIPGGKE